MRSGDRGCGKVGSLASDGSVKMLREGIVDYPDHWSRLVGKGQRD